MPSSKKSKKEKKDKKTKVSKSSKSTRSKKSSSSSKQIVPYVKTQEVDSVKMGKSDFDELKDVYRFDTDESSSDSEDEREEGEDVSAALVTTSTAITTTTSGVDSGGANSGGAKKGAKKEGTWQQRMEVQYQKSLYKEYGIICFEKLVTSLLKQSNEGRRGKIDYTIGLRWRTSQEVLNKKGYASCGNRRCPSFHTTPFIPLPSDIEYGKGLMAYEFPFTHNQLGELKCTIVNVRLCDGCSVLGIISSFKDKGVKVNEILERGIEVFRGERRAMEEKMAVREKRDERFGLFDNASGGEGKKGKKGEEEVDELLFYEDRRGDP
jgi:hypothetical protein